MAVRDLTQILSSQVLPVNGDPVDSDTFALDATMSRLVLYVTYTRGDVGGRPRLELLSPVGGNDFQATDTSGTNASLQFRDGPVPADANPLRYELPIVASGERNLFIRARESPLGVQATPGTLRLQVQSILRE